MKMLFKSYIFIITLFLCETKPLSYENENNEKLDLYNLSINTTGENETTEFFIHSYNGTKITKIDSMMTNATIRIKKSSNDQIDKNEHEPFKINFDIIDSTTSVIELPDYLKPSKPLIHIAEAQIKALSNTNEETNYPPYHVTPAHDVLESKSKNSVKNVRSPPSTSYGVPFMKIDVKSIQPFNHSKELQIDPVSNAEQDNSNSIRITKSSYAVPFRSVLNLSEENQNYFPISLETKEISITTNEEKVLHKTFSLDKNERAFNITIEKSISSEYDLINGELIKKS